jgi:hypothetical protein
MATSGRAHGIRPRPAAQTPPDVTLPFRFRHVDFDIRVLPEPLRPYRLKAPLPLSDDGEVAMVTMRGVRYDHPGAQARYGINLLESYRLTGERANLDGARPRRVGWSIGGSCGKADGSTRSHSGITCTATSSCWHRRGTR